MPKQAPAEKIAEKIAPPAHPNQSLIDGLACLQALAVTGEPLGGRDLARRLGWNPMRVNRLLKTLAYLGVARQSPDRRYTVGSGMHVLSVQSLLASGLLRRAVEPVQALPWRAHAIALGVLWRDQVCYLFHAAPGQPLTSALGAHPLYPATQSSIGMMLLAHQSEPQIRDLFGDRPIPGYPGGAGRLIRELKRIRDGGHAYVVQKRSPYTASVAVADRITALRGTGAVASGDAAKGPTVAAGFAPRGGAHRRRRRDGRRLVPVMGKAIR